MYKAYQGPAGALTELVGYLGGTTRVTALHQTLVQDSIDVRTAVDNDVAYARFSPTTSFIQPTSRMYVTNTFERETTNGMWFALGIPKDATITSATLTLYEGEHTTWTGGQDTFVIRAEQADNAAHWSDHADAAARYDNVGATQTVDLNGTFAIGDPHVITLPVAMIQQIVDRAGWASGNQVCLMAYNETNLNEAAHQLYGHEGVGEALRPRLQVEFEYLA